MAVKFAPFIKKSHSKDLPQEPAGEERLFLRGANGVTLILVHGLTGTPNEMKYLSRFFHRKGYTVSCPRLANHGEPLPVFQKTTWQQCYASVRDEFRNIRDRDPGETVFVAGLSMGALLGLVLAHEFPQEVAGVGCLSPTLFYDGWNVPWTRHFLPLAYFTPLKHFFYFKEEPPYGIKNVSIRQRMHEYYSNADLEDTEGFSRFGYPCFPVSLLCQLRHLRKYLTQKLPLIKTPVQLIQSRQDDMTSVRNAEYIYEKVSSPTKEIVFLEDSYHVITADQERQTVACKMLEFFSRLQASVRPSRLVHL